MKPSIWIVAGAVSMVSGCASLTPGGASPQRHAMQGEHAHCEMHAAKHKDRAATGAAAADAHKDHDKGAGTLAAGSDGQSCPMMKKP